MRVPGTIVYLCGFGSMLAAGWLGFPAVLYRREPQPATFSHKIHQEKASMQCADCHALRDDGTFAGIPSVKTCANCHAAPMGTSAAEKRLVEEYVGPGREIPWRVYARQPMNVSFSHIRHVRAAKLACETCHGSHGSSGGLRDYEVNRISGYSRDIWGHSISRLRNTPGQGMKMEDCEHCHEARHVTAGCLGCHQ